MSARSARWGARLGDVALTFAAVLGAVCIVLVIAAALFDVRVILFRTGSMSPTIPTGSAAIVRTIPASEIHVGDVVTVERPGQLPITHRVVTVTEAGAPSPDQRVLTMRGDANAADDPFPYTVERVRLVLFAVPGIAPAVAALGSPWVLGAVTIAATVLVVAMFWPRRRAPARQDGETKEDGGNEADDEGGESHASVPGRAVGVAVTLLALVAVGVAGPGDVASAADEQPQSIRQGRVIQGEVIRLVSVESSSMNGLQPGSTGVWQVGVSADAATPGTVTVHFSARGDADLALRVTIEVCERRWTASGCVRPVTAMADQPLPEPQSEQTLLRMADTEERWLRIAVTMPPNAPEAAGVVDLVVRAVGVGDDVSVGDGSALPDTGGRPLWVTWLLAGVGAALLTSGALVLARGRAADPRGGTP